MSATSADFGRRTSAGVLASGPPAKDRKLGGQWLRHRDVETLHPMGA